MGQRGYSGLFTYENFVTVRLSDLLDMCLVILEYENDLTLLDYFLDFIPVIVTEADIQDYFDTFLFFNTKQVDDLRLKMDVILSRYHSK